MSSPTSASASSCSIRGASWPKGHPTKSFTTRLCGRPISVVDPTFTIKGLRAGYKSKAILAEGIAFLPQGRCNFPVMTIDENLQMAAYTLRDARVKADRDYVYDLFPILK